MLCPTCKQPEIPEVFRDTFGKKIKLLRTQHNKTLKEVQYDTLICISHISLMENDKRKPSIDNLMKLASLYDVSNDYLLGEKLWKTG